MKTIELTIREFYNFKSIATFIFQMWREERIIYIEADAEELAQLGY
jgi:hypothetical protein